MNDRDHNNNASNQNHDNKNDSRMMWGMMILCLLPIILLFFGTKLGPSYKWIIFVIAIVFMFRHHLNFFNRKESNYINGVDSKENNSKRSVVFGAQNPKNQSHEEHKKHGGCCG